MFCRYVVNGDWGCACDDCTGRTQLQKEIAAMRAELAEWRSGKRRVIGWSIGPNLRAQFWTKGARARARAFAKKINCKLYRITVGPPGNVRPWVKK